MGWGFINGLLLAVCLTASQSLAAGEIDDLLTFPYATSPPSAFTLEVVRQDYESLERNQSVVKTPLRIGQRKFANGIGTHSISHLRVYAPEPLAHFAAWVGVDRNGRTEGIRGSVVFSVAVGGREVARSRVLRSADQAEHLEVGLAGAQVFDLHVSDGGDGPGWDHADWAEAILTTTTGKSIRLDELPVRPAPYVGSAYPFSFQYGGKPAETQIVQWPCTTRTNFLDPDRTQFVRTWTDSATGLRVTWEAVRFADFAALEWVLYFENTGTQDTPLIENIAALDLTLRSGSEAAPPFQLHRTKGAPSDPTDFEPTVVPLTKGKTERLSAGGGRSSNKDFPFFKIQTGDGSWIVAVGWSGQWHATAQVPDGHHLRLSAGMEQTRFRLHPGERVRSPRMLVFYQPGDTLESNARFRQLIYQHYAARRSGQPQLPTLFCNTCFTRGGAWLNECNASNQISLIRAYAPLGLEALITDAGWFEGGWPNGAGNWTPRKDTYPAGMQPVAAAEGSRDGLWIVV